MNRRRFLTILAAVTASPVLGQVWEGTALGARANTSGKAQPGAEALGQPGAGRHQHGGAG